MNAFGCLMRLNMQRMASRKAYLLVTYLMIALAIAGAVLLANHGGMKVKLAVVGTLDRLSGLDRFQVESVHDAPPVSALVRQKYDGIVTVQADGAFEVLTIKGEKLEAEIRAVLAGGTMPDEPQRGIGTTMMGFLLMILLLQGVMFLTLFGEDRESGTLRRTAVTPAGLKAYLGAQCLVAFLMLYVPTLAIIGVTKLGFGMELGYSLPAIAALLVVPVLLSVGFALFVMAACRSSDNAVMTGGALTVISCLVSGTVYAVTNEQAWWKYITEWLPQTQWMSVVGDLEQGHAASQWLGPLSYVLAWVAAFLIAGWAVCAHRYRAGHY